MGIEKDGADGYAELAAVIRDRAGRIIDSHPDGDRRDDAELLLALARMVIGKSVYDSFGAPGRWGYGTAIGDALVVGYGIRPPHTHSVTVRQGAWSDTFRFTPAADENPLLAAQAETLRRYPHLAAAGEWTTRVTGPGCGEG